MADLQRGAKKLNSVSDTAAESKLDAKSSSFDSDSVALQSLESLYNSCDGDLDLMYANHCT